MFSQRHREGNFCFPWPAVPLPQPFYPRAYKRKRGEGAEEKRARAVLPMNVIRPPMNREVSSRTAEQHHLQLWAPRTKAAGTLAPRPGLSCMSLQRLKIIPEHLLHYHLCEPESGKEASCGLPLRSFARLGSSVGLRVSDTAVRLCVRSSAVRLLPPPPFPNLIFI